VADLEMTSYNAVINYAGHPESIACACSSCDWKGMAVDVMKVKVAYLTPGDESPAGRCPECEALVYVEKPDYKALLQAIVNDADVTGCADGTYLVRTSLINQAREALKGDPNG
jgi:hypothetical protein